MYMFIYYTYLFCVNNYKLKHTVYKYEDDKSSDAKAVNVYKLRATNTNFLAAVVILVFALLFFYDSKKDLLFFLCLTFIGVLIAIRVSDHLKIFNILCGVVNVPVITYFVIMSVFLPYNLSYNPYSLHTISMHDVEITAFNTKFLQYQGDYKNGSQIKSLIQEIISSNANPDNADRQVLLDCDVEGVSLNASDSKYTKIEGLSNIKNNWKYSVDFEYHYSLNKKGEREGLIEKAVIRKVVSNDSTPSPSNSSSVESSSTSIPVSNDMIVT